MIASDIHGSVYYCKKLLKCFETENPQRLILLGDILYHGPRNDLPLEYNPKGIISLLNDIKSNLLCVRGNCDSEVDQMVLDFPIMADSALIYADGFTMFATHGHIYNNSNLPPLNKGDILLHGHTHVQAMEEFENYYYFNPGSVSIPKENNQNSYMIYQDGCFSLKNLDGEIISSKKILNTCGRTAQ